MAFDGERVRQNKCEFPGCNKTFVRPSKLQQHERIHTGERPYQCNADGCLKTYARSAHLRRHKLQAHAGGTRQETSVVFISCCQDGCDATFVSSYNLKKHMSRVHTEPFTCAYEGCGQRFRKRNQIREHLLKHEGILPFQCHIASCLRKFSQECHLQRHLKSHRGYACDACTEHFEKWTLLRKHKAQLHRTVHKCDLCTKSYVQKHQLRRHRRTTHAAEVEMFSCPWDGCPRVYFDLRNVTSHIKSYHQDTRFTCQFNNCGKTFATRQKLQLHGNIHDASYRKPAKKPRLNLHRKKSFAARATAGNERILGKSTDVTNEELHISTDNIQGKQWHTIKTDNDRVRNELNNISNNLQQVEMRDVSRNSGAET